jgi:pimeloyl-ACP methyl ester carboxylesterase
MGKFQNFLISVLAVALTALPASAQENDPDYCGPQGNLLAHCDGHIPVFKSVVVTIHGWNGSCKTTFGEDTSDNFGSIYSLFREKRFFDFDCFGYDSKKFPIEEHVKNLGNRLEILEKLGYNYVMFVTHSTGGIIALNYLVDRLDKALQTQTYDTMAVPTLVAWATPIKGLRWHIVFGGNALNFVKATQMMLPQLDEDGNPYLRELRNRLKHYRGNLAKVPLRSANNYNTYVEFFHGMDDDWVVEPIERHERNDGWIWESPYGELTDIDVGHLANIGDPGDPMVHNFPERIVESKAIDSLPLKIDEGRIFPLDRPVFDERSLPLQIAMVKGVSYYAKRVRLRNDVDTLIRFLRRLLLNEFPRSKEVDYLLLKELRNRVFSTHLVKENDAVRNAALRFVREVLTRYKSETAYSKRSPGFGEPDFVTGVQNFALEVYDAIMQIPDTTPGVQEARVVVASLMLRSLKSPQRKIQETSIKDLSRRTSSFSDSVVRKANLIGKLDAYYTPRASALGETAKERIGLIMLGLSERGGGVGLKAAAFMNKEVTFGGKMIPAWASFQSNKIDKAIMRSYNRILRKKSDAPEWRSEWAVTYGGISARAGSKGNQQDFIKQGHLMGFSIYKDLPEAQREKVKNEIQKFGTPKPDKGYYNLQKKNNPADWAKMVPRLGKDGLQPHRK